MVRSQYGESLKLFTQRLKRGLHLFTQRLKRGLHIYDVIFHSISDITPSLFLNTSMIICNTNSVYVYLVFTCKSMKTETPERYSSPFHTRAFSFTKIGKDEKPLAVGSGSTDII